MNPFLSIVIPAFNEANRIIPGLQAVDRFVKSQERQVELIVVDDGSSDGTVEVVQSIVGKADYFRLISYPHNRGKGYAIRKGMLEARGEYVVFMDADLSTNIDAIPQFLTSLEKDAEIAIASRDNQSSVIARKQPRLRRILGRGFRVLTRATILPGISDFVCGFKMFRRNVAQHLFSLQTIDDWAFDVEILVLARRFGYQISEVPISWSDVDGTKVRLFRDIIRTLVSLAWIGSGQIAHALKPRRRKELADLTFQSSVGSSHIPSSR